MTNQNSEQQFNQTSQLTPSPKSNFNLKYVLIVLILVGVVVGGVFAWQYIEKTIFQPFLIPQPPLVPTPAEKILEKNDKAFIIDRVLIKRSSYEWNPITKVYDEKTPYPAAEEVKNLLSGPISIRKKNNDIFLTPEVLKNAEYYVIDSWHEPQIFLRKFKDGVCVLCDEKTYIHVSLGATMVFGDINNDGKQDAVVVMYKDAIGGTLIGVDLAIVINVNGKPIHVYSESIGDRANIQSLKIEEGKIIVEFKEWPLLNTVKKIISLEFLQAEIEKTPEKKLLVVIDDNNNFRLIDSAGAEHAFLETGLSKKGQRILQRGIIKNKIFFYGGFLNEETLKSINTDGIIKEYEFVKTRFNEVVSPNGQKIVWHEWVEAGPAWGNTIQLVISDIDGKNRRVLFEETFPKEEDLEETFLKEEGKWPFWFFEIIGWSEDSQKIYFTKNKMFNGGGYMPLGMVGGENFFVIDINDNQYLKLIEDSGDIINFLPNENIVSFVSFDSNNKLSIRTYNWKKRRIIKTITIPILINEEYAFLGNMFLSPNKKQIVYSTAVGNIEDERFSVFTADIDGTNIKRIINKHPALVGASWYSDYEIILTDWLHGKKGTYLINKDGSNLRKISEHQFIGLMDNQFIKNLAE